MTDIASAPQGVLKKVSLGTPLTTDDLAQAAANLTRLRAWVTDLYPMCIEYEGTVFLALESTKENGDWTNFIVDIFIDIAIGLAAGAAVATGNPLAVPAIAALSAFLHDWGIGKDKPNDLDDEFAVFMAGHQKMQFEIEQQLSHLVDPSNNYSNLQDAWKDNIQFNGKTYTIGDLASSNFPGLGDEYNALQAGALTYFKKALWNLAIMKCCTYYENYHDHIYTAKHPGALLDYAKQTFYPANKGVYLRGQLYAINDDSNEYELIYWNLGIGGYEFPDTASNILFKDDIPGNIINPDGLFNRSYVFEQFSITKPDFSKGHELSAEAGGDFAISDDWNFTGGYFPKLTK